jgi:hypothetical protein
VCPIFHHLDCYVRAHRAFKGTFIVVGLVRLDAGEPHLCLAGFAKRTTDDPLMRKILILSHTTPRFSFTDSGVRCAGYSAHLNLGGKVQRGVTQALAITFALSCRFEDAFGQRGLLHRGLLLRSKAGPSIV